MIMLMMLMVINTIFPVVSSLGAYLILKLQGAALIGGQRLIERGAYFKVSVCLYERRHMIKNGMGRGREQEKAIFIPSS